MAVSVAWAAVARSVIELGKQSALFIVTAPVFTQLCDVNSGQRIDAKIRRVHWQTRGGVQRILRSEEEVLLKQSPWQILLSPPSLYKKIKRAQMHSSWGYQKTHLLIKH